MQSVATACGSPHRLYAELSALSAGQLARARHVVLLVVDGLGLRTLLRHPRCPHLQRHLIGAITSVFPSTTASAITTFLTGLAPAQHGLTGWHMRMDEIDQTLSILPLLPRAEPMKVIPEELPARLFEQQSLCRSLTRDCWVVAPKSIAYSPFNRWHTQGAEMAAYSLPPELFSHVCNLVEETSRQRFVYAYFPDVDTLSHEYGSNSPQARQALADFDRLFGDLVRRLHGSNTWLLVTADHGFIDSPHRHLIELDNHPQLAALLQSPLCGERRAAYCYVAAEDRPVFEDYVRRRLARAVHVYPSSRLIAAGWFGPPPYHPRLQSRVGDFTLVMKDNWTIKDWLPNEKRYTMIGVHGGISTQEMRVPLVAVLV